MKYRHSQGPTAIKLLVTNLRTLDGAQAPTDFCHDWCPRVRLLVGLSSVGCAPKVAFSAVCALTIQEEGVPREKIRFEETEHYFRNES